MLFLLPANLLTWGPLPSFHPQVWARLAQVCSQHLCPHTPLASQRPVLPSPSLWLPEFLWEER